MAAILVGLAAILTMVIVGFAQGREISIWPPRIGPRPQASHRSIDGVPAHRERTTQARWEKNSRDVDEREHWISSDTLVVGVQYSPKFLKDFFDVIQARSRKGKRTAVLALEPDGEAARYLTATNTGTANIAEAVAEIERLIAEADCGHGCTLLKRHDRVLRYSFVLTEEHVWVKFFSNAPHRTLVPAVRIDRSSELYDFFREDSRKLEEASA